jgi:hypothetical protein
MSFPIRKIQMLEMPKIAMLSTFIFRGYPVTNNPENSITFKKYLFTKGGKTMSFLIRKIGMLEMPKIAMLSTAFPNGIRTRCMLKRPMLGRTTWYQ